MFCRICGNDIGDKIILLPIRQPNGNLNTSACLDCAEKSSAYCNKHKKPHMGFEDETTACRLCIEELVSSNACRAPAVYKELVQAATQMPEAMELSGFIELSSMITGQSGEISLLRFIASKAQRMGVSIDDVIELIKITRSIEHLI